MKPNKGAPRNGSQESKGVPPPPRITRIGDIAIRAGDGSLKTLRRSDFPRGYPGDEWWQDYQIEKAATAKAQARTKWKHKGKKKVRRLRRRAIDMRKLADRLDAEANDLERQIDAA